MITPLSNRRPWVALPLWGLGALVLLTGRLARAQEATFPGLPGDVDVSFSSESKQTTPVGDVTFHGPFNRDTLYVASDKLPAHEFIDISFDLLILRSWDGAVNPNTEDQMPLDIGPDCFRLGIHDGPTLLYNTFSNTPTDPPGFRYESMHQNYPSQVPGDTYAPWNAAAAKNTLGYKYPWEGPPKPVPQDAIYKIHYIVPHKADHVTLEMTGIGLQAMQDENWGVANVAIKALDGKDVKKPAEKEIAAAFDAALNKDDADLPGKFQTLINGMDDTTGWLAAHVKPQPVDAARLATYIDAIQGGNELVEKGLSAQIAILRMGHAAEPALRDARRDLDGPRLDQMDAALSVFEVRAATQNAAVHDWLLAPEPEKARPSEEMRRVVLATRVLEIIGTPKAMALRNTLTLASAKELEALPKPAAMAHPGAMAGDHFAAKLADLLGVPDTGADVLPAIVQAEQTVLASKADAGISSAARQAAARGTTTLPAIAPEVDASLDALAAALLKGPHVTTFIEKYLPLMEIGDGHGGRSDNPTFDVDQHLERLSWDLWGRAGMVQAKGPKRASDLARAAIMLAALSDYDMGWTEVNQATRDAAQARRVLNLPEGKYEELSKLIATRLGRLGSDSSMDAGLITDVISGAKDQPVSAPLAERVAQAYDKEFRSALPQLGTHFRTINYTWEFLNLMKARKSAEGEAAVRKVLEGWKKDYPDPDLTRWIDEALTRDGPVPGTMVGFGVSENGTSRSLTPEEYLKFLDSHGDAGKSDPTAALLRELIEPATQPATATQPKQNP